MLFFKCKTLQTAVVQQTAIKTDVKRHIDKIKALQAAEMQ
jgi:hypothetical protein